MNTRSRAFVLVLVSSLAGCLSEKPGAPFNASRTTEIRVGQNQATIQGMFGAPLFNLPLHGGSCVLRWIYYSAPSSLLLVDFDANGRVCR
jgi:hypothetical protein